MKKFKFYLCITCCIFLNANFAFGFEAIPTADLLISYLENDNDLRKNVIDAEKAQLSLDSTKINNGFDVTLSTGTVTIKTEKDGTSISVRPSVEVKIPQASNLSISASSNINYKDDTSKSDETKLSASVDLISTTSLSRKISLMKAERSLIEAKRRLDKQAINTEKAFYSELKSILNSTNSIISSEKNLYTTKLDFEKVKAQGYSTGSSTYRLAQMKVLSSEHDINSAKRDLIQSYVLFYTKCGYEVSETNITDFYSLIPTDITAVEPLKIGDFDPDSYTEVESALWTNKINTLQRQTNSNFSLSANGGVTLKNTTTTARNVTSTTTATTVDAGLSSKIGGLTLGAGISIPIDNENDKNPTYTLSASISPNTFRKNSITKQMNNLEEEQELLAIETARMNYENKVIESNQNLANLLWTKNTNDESYEMYAELERDLYNWYNQGIINESEYLSSKVNTQSYTVRRIINAIDFIIYNDNIITMFVEQPQEK